MRKGLCLAVLLALSFPAAAQAAVPVTAGKAVDPASDVYIVTSREHYARHGEALGKLLEQRAARDGQPLVITRLQERQLPDLGRRMHDQEKNGGGYFAFTSQQDAERFIASDRSAVAARAAGIRYTINNGEVVDALMSGVTETGIREGIDSLSAFPNRYYNSSHGHDAAVAIRDNWQALATGRDDVTVELVSCTSGINCGVQPSVVLTIRGTKLPNQIVVLGGHLDSVSSTGSGDNMVAPGADDNASGIATLTEVLRVAMASGYKPLRTVQFMGYAAEEAGLRGSNSIARSYAQDARNVVGVLQLDMTDYRTGSIDMRISTDNSSQPLRRYFARLFDTYLAPLGYVRGTDTCGYACSDHASWTQAGYPAAMMFEGGEENGDYFPYIHSKNDTMGNLGNTAMPSVPFAQFGLAFMAELAKGSLHGAAR